jgi:hypothetical protein
MTNSWRLSTLLIAALILSACDAGGLPPGEAFDWCYRFAFDDPARFDWDNPSSMPYAINVASGNPVNGIGISTVQTGGEDREIVANFSQGLIIEHAHAAIILTRGVGTGSVTVSAVADLFGQQIQAIDQVIPDGTTRVELSYPNSSLTATRDASVTIQANGQLAIAELIVYGFGANPFPENDCRTPTSTPSPMSSPSATSTATASPTPTNTPTPTGTVTDLCFRVFYDFRTAPRGWNDQIFKTWESGQGIVALPQQNVSQSVVEMRLSRGYMFTEQRPFTLVRWTYSAQLGANPSSIEAGISAQSVTVPLVAGTNNQVTWQSNSAAGYFPNQLINPFFTAAAHSDGPNTQAQGGITIHSLEIRGKGPAPTTDGWELASVVVTEPCWDQTPTPTTTSPTPTRTPTRTPIGEGLTGVPGSPTPTLTRTPLMVGSPTPFTPTAIPPTAPPPPTATLPTAPPPPTITPLATLIPLPTTMPGTPDFEATWVVPGFGTPLGTPEFATLVGTPQLSTLTPSDGGDVVGERRSDIYNGLATAAVAVNQLPADVREFIPSLDGVSEFSGYARWVISGVSLQELMGTKFYPVAQHVLFLFSLSIIITGLQLLVRLIVFVFKWVWAVLKTILKLFGR